MAEEKGACAERSGGAAVNPFQPPGQMPVNQIRCLSCAQLVAISDALQLRDASNMLVFCACHACIRVHYTIALRSRDVVFRLLRVVREPVEMAEIDDVCQAAERFLS